MTEKCVEPNCRNLKADKSLFCAECLNKAGGRLSESALTDADVPTRRRDDIPMSEKYPKYYKKVPKGATELDTYALNKMFPVDDPSGCILHARKKLLVPGVRTGGKTMVDDIREARDTLTRWLQLNT